jgi:DNA-binding transcriptional regulator YdaS (Cro superfamily)
MGSGSKKKQGGLEDIAAKLNGTGDTASNWANQDRGRNEDNATKISKSYWDLYNGIGSGGAGSAGGGYQPETYKNDFWNQMQNGSLDQMNTMQHGLGGVYDKMVGKYGIGGEEGYNLNLRQGAADNSAQFGAMKRGLQQSGALRGSSGPGFGEQNLALAATGARTGNANSLAARLAMQKNIESQNIEGAKLGAQGATDVANMRAQGAGQVDAQELRAIEARNQAARYNSSRGDDEYNRKMSILGEQRGLRGEAGSELQYLNSAQAGYGGAGGTYSALDSRKSGLANGIGYVGTLAGAAGGLMSGGLTSGIGGVLGGLTKKVPQGLMSGSNGIGFGFGGG